MVKRFFKKPPPLWGWAAGFIVLFLIGVFLGRSCADKTKNYRQTQILLGTVVDIQVRNTDEKLAEEGIEKAFAEIKRIDNLFTTYNEESPVWKLNNATDSIISVDEEIYSLLVLCDSITKLSVGSFDVSLDNLTQAWGFYSNNPQLPVSEAIDSALFLSGWQNIKLLDDNQIVKQKKVGLNFGAIAKGYAVDKAIYVLKDAGINEALVNAGGEIKAIGNEWVVGVQHPREKNSIINKIMLNGTSVATSGDYENYFEENGVRYHHILDPMTGYPTRGIQSVTVLNADNAFADGLATAVFVMGIEKGLELIEKLRDTEVMIIDEQGKIYYSSRFEKFLIN
ncbi:MAG: FAD:protein FMN transferase [bacterium]|nr:FAD:protein FMN transferase [bacterium]